MQGEEGETEAAHFLWHSSQCIRMQLWLLQKQQKRIKTIKSVTNGAIVIHTQRLKSDPGGNLLS